MTTDGGLDTAAELRALRAEIVALRRQVVREQETRERSVPPQPGPPPPRSYGGKVHDIHGVGYPPCWCGYAPPPTPVTASPASRSAPHRAWTAVRGGWLAVFGDIRRHQ